MDICTARAFCFAFHFQHLKDFFTHFLLSLVGFAKMHWNVTCVSLTLWSEFCCAGTATLQLARSTPSDFELLLVHHVWLTAFSHWTQQAQCGGSAPIHLCVQAGIAQEQQAAPRAAWYSRVVFAAVVDRIKSSLIHCDDIWLVQLDLHMDTFFNFRTGFSPFGSAKCCDNAASYLCVGL